MYKDSGLDFDKLEEQVIALNEALKLFNYNNRKRKLQK